MAEFEDLGIKIHEGKQRFYDICPECNPTRKYKGRKSLTVNNEPGNRWFKCHNCGFSGNLDIMDKYDEVAKNSRMPKQIAKTYSKATREYFQGRGIRQGTAMKEGIFEYRLGVKTIIGFPIYINKTLVNVKYLNASFDGKGDDIKWWQMNQRFGTRSIFMGMQSIKFKDNREEGEIRTIIIAEGEIEMLTWKECGYNNAVSVPQGAPNPESKNLEKEFGYLADPYVQSFFHADNVDRIIIATDNDKPGEFLRDSIVRFFGRERCRYVNYPEGYKDANEVYNGDAKKGLPALGQEGIDELLANVSAFPVKGVIRPSDLIYEMEDYAKHGFTPGYGIGVPEVDKLFTLKPKHISFVTGIPSSGKSIFTRWYLCQFVSHNIDKDFKWAIFTPENRPVAREFAKMAEVVAGKRFQEGYVNSMTPEIRMRTLKYLERHFMVISPDRKNYESWGNKITDLRINTLESILNYLVYLKKTQNIFGYVIDAWNKIEHEQPRHMTDTNFISQQLDYLIDFNEFYDVHGWVVVHPTKTEQQNMNYKMPSLYNIKGSSAWKEKADVGLILHRYLFKKRDKEDIPEDADEYDKYYIDTKAPTYLSSEKLRFEELGEPGRVKLTLDYFNGNRFIVADNNLSPKEKKEKLEKELKEKNINTIYDKKEDEDDEFGDELPF